MKLSEETRLELSNQFEAYAEDNSINMEYPEDWHPWWDCFFAGYAHAVGMLTGAKKVE